jgi:NAD(P)-dependent dehydrogenase (short-subunit alcohol dehydrogenase family)
MSQPPLHGYRILITGGTSGLGRALVAELIGRGAHVAFVARHADAVERTARALRASHGITGDVASKEDVYPIAIQALGLLGGVDVLVNNASSLGPVPLVPLADTACEDLELALATNLLGPFRLTKALLGALASASRDGRRPLVLNISSDAAVTPYANWGAYGASKAALQHLSRIWDQELEPEGVRVVSVDPGDMDTPLHALAVPDARRDGLKPPRAAAREIAELIEAHVAPPVIERTDTNLSVVGPFVEVR